MLFGGRGLRVGKASSGLRPQVGRETCPGLVPGSRQMEPGACSHLLASWDLHYSSIRAHPCSLACCPSDLKASSSLLPEARQALSSLLSRLRPAACVLLPEPQLAVELGPSLCCRHSSSYLALGLEAAGFLLNLPLPLWGVSLTSQWSDAPAPMFAVPV